MIVVNAKAKTTGENILNLKKSIFAELYNNFVVYLHVSHSRIHFNPLH